MKRLKLLFNVSDVALTVTVFVLITAMVPVQIIVQLINRSSIMGTPCLYDAFIGVNSTAVWTFINTFVMFYVIYIQKYDMNSAIVIRRKNIKNVWINSQINIVIAAALYSLYCAAVTGAAGSIMTEKICNWGERLSRAFYIKGDIVENPPQLWLIITAFVIDTFVCLYISGTVMMLVWWITGKQWIGFFAAIGIISFEHIANMGYLSFYYTLNADACVMNGISVWKNIAYPVVLFLSAMLVTTMIIRRKDFL